jgi:hypothetical protein
MHPITRSDIVGARITEIYSTFEDRDGYFCTVIYFTVDRGFTFILPVPGFRWHTAEVPSSAERLPDESQPRSYRIEGSGRPLRFISEETVADDTIKRIKQRTIAGVYCRKMDPELGFHPPDDALLVFDDGSRAYCVTLGPHGVSDTGLHYQTDVRELPPAADLVDFFDVPLDLETGEHECEK